MKAFAVTNKGTEQLCAEEIQELIGAKSTPKERVVIFDTSKYEDLCKLVYLGQSFSKIALMLGDFNFSDKNDFFSKLKSEVIKSEAGKWLHEGVTFRNECIRNGEHDFKSVDVEQKSGGYFLEACNGLAKVNLTSPAFQMLIFINNNYCIFGIDFAGIDLSLREYKIFSHRQSLNGTIAYSLVRLSEWNKKEILIDPFCGSATIPIEAAFWQMGYPINNFRKEKLSFTKMDLGFDQTKWFLALDKKPKFPSSPIIHGSDMLLSAINSSEKNAKIAGIHKACKISRIDMDWLDTKFEENEVSKIVTHFPDNSKSMDEKDTDKLYKEFFYQIDFIMKKKKAVIVAICQSPEKLSSFGEEFGFKLDSKYEFWQGKEILNVAKIVR